MSTNHRILNGREAILAAGRDDPFVSCFLTDNAQGVASHGAVVWHRVFNDRSVLMGDGPADAAARLMSDTAHRFHPNRITMPIECFEKLPDRLRPEKVGRWHWFFTRQAPPPQQGESDCQWLDTDDYSAITALLDEAFPNASSRPVGTSDGQRWFGARDDAGNIVACGLASASNGAGPMLGSVAVHPGKRRRGLGSAVTSWATRNLLKEGHPMVALGSYVGEDATHRLYRRLGFTDTRVLASGSL